MPSISTDSAGADGVKSGLIFALLAAVSFQIAFEIPALNFLVLLYSFSLVTLSNGHSLRVAFRLGFLSGLLVAAPQFAWFWHIFGFASVCLWAVLSFFTGLFVLAVHCWRSRFGSKCIWLAVPVFWTGLEYFRSELYFLRFSWLSTGYVFSGHSGILPVGALGVYGFGFIVFLIAGSAFQLNKKRGLLWLLTASALIAGLTSIPKLETTQLQPTKKLRIAGIQLEFPPELKVASYLDQLVSTFPDAEVLVLSEYTFDGPVPKRVRAWCREHGKYLIAGGRAQAERAGQFYNTAFVVGTNGDVVFQQVKSVPIQFFKDGLPAPRQEVWESPWGKIAMCVCYDLSYRRVMDRFMRKGAQALIVPFMDVAGWGEHQHALHARVGPMRALEYHIPIFRLGSSGISQVIDRQGQILASEPYPGQERMIAGTLELAAKARVPLDSLLAPTCSIGVALFFVWMAAEALFRKRRSETLSKAA